MDDEKFSNYFGFDELKKKLDNVKQIMNDLNYKEDKTLPIHNLLQNCIEMLNIGKNELESMKKNSFTSSNIVNNLISYEKGVIESFKHCSESNLIYGKLIMSVEQLLTELFKKTSELQILYFSILEKVIFDFTQKEDLSLLLNALRHIWYGAEAVYNASNKIMTTNWKVYITMSQKYSTELKKNIINDDPIYFLCTEIKKIVLTFHSNNETSLKLSTYMMSVLVKLCSYGSVIKSHNILMELVVYLNSYWLSDTQDVVIVKNRLSQFVDHLVLKSDETFVEVFLSSCQDIINNNSPSQKISALNIATLLLKRLIETKCDHQAYEIISIVFQLVRCSDPIMCCYDIDIYESLLINLSSVIIVSDYNLFEKVEKIIIQNILNTEYWPAMLSIDLWIIIMRYLSSDLCNIQFSKLVKLFEMLIIFPCFTQCPQHIYFEILLRRHFALISDKKQLVNVCPQFEMSSLKSAVGILHIPTLSKYESLSELVKILSILPEQKNYEHLNKEVIHLWNSIKDNYPSNFLCALIDVSIGSEILLKQILPQTKNMLSIRFKNDTTEMKRCRLKLIRSILLIMPTFQENLIVDIFLEYLFDQHPLVRQWTVETIVYFSSVIKNKNNLISILFKRPEVTAIITSYLKMKTNHNYNQNDFIQYFEQLSLCGKFHHTCLFDNKIYLLNQFNIIMDHLNNMITEKTLTEEELNLLRKHGSVLNNICKGI